MPRLTAIDRFRSEFRRWVAAHNKAKSFATSADALLDVLERRIGEDRLARIGSAYLNRWLKTEEDPDRGYFVREADRPGPHGGQFTLTNQGQGQVAPCWELFVQLADYAWLRTIAERHGHAVRLEDRLMDVTVRASSTLILYVEQKVSRATAEKLLKGMRRYGKQGFTLADPDRGDDALRKAKYLVRDGSHPRYFALSAVDFQQLYLVEYLEGQRFRLLDDPRPLSAPLAEYRPHQNAEALPWSPVDPLALEIERLCPNIWASVGSGQTAYNFYCQADRGDALVVGVDENGEVWTDVAALGQDRAARLAAGLARQGVVLDTTRQWTFWRTGDAKLNLAAVDSTAIAEAVRDAVDPEPALRQ